MEEEEEFKMSPKSAGSELNQRISPVLHNPSSLTQKICMDSSVNLPETSLVTHTTRSLYDVDVRHVCEIMEEVDRSKRLPKPIGFEWEQKMARMNYSVNRSETSFARGTEGLLYDFDWHNCETKKEIERIKMLSKHTDFELKQKTVLIDHSVNRSETSIARFTEKSLPAEVQLDETEPRKSFSDNQIDALNFQLEDLTVAAPTPSTDASVITVSTVSDNKPITSTFPESDRISPSTDVARTVFSDTQSPVTSTAVCEMEQTHQSSTVISAKTTEANAPTSNWKQFTWNPDAPPFIPHNSTSNYNTGSQNHHSTSYGIGTSDASITFMPSHITAPIQMQTLAFADQQTLSGQNMPSIVHAALPQMFSSGYANAYNAATPVHYNIPVVQNVPNSAAPMITATNYLTGSQQIYSNANRSGYVTYVPSYYNAPAAQNMSNIAAPMTTATNYVTRSRQIYSNVNESGYGTYVSYYYSAPVAQA
ncbi:unnamed protein product [Onchocerca flexuosa]|uniref:LsmAD domain-containing protein n=1 Tax=Onchocerca flexuosa TaxID=387005 RepID=A0A183H7G7_9BILA|nr:unnamed protein product [Onchocerca flexuosa]